MKPIRLPLLLALCATLAGCGSPAPAPPAPSATTAATATAAPPPDGPVEVARLWVEAADHAYATGDTVPLVSLSRLPNCAECRRIVAEVTRIHSRGYTVRGGVIRILNATEMKNPNCARFKTCESERTDPLVNVDAWVTELTVTTPDGKRDPASSPEHPQLELSVFLHRYAGRWLVSQEIAIDR